MPRPALIVRTLLWLWFAAAVAAGYFLALQRIAPGAIPLVIFGLTALALYAYFRLPGLRDWIDDLDPRALFQLHLTRFVGVYFLYLFNRGELPYAFAVPAGIGDIVVALLALALIADDLGEEVARRPAQELVVYHRRPGGQSQFSALLDIERTEGRFTPLLGWMRERLEDPLTVETLAAQSNMSPRNFARAFTAETGVTPAKAVERLRLESARERVEHSTDSIDVIAQDVGFGDPERMRRAFVRAFGQPPQALRRLARTETVAAATQAG